MTVAPLLSVGGNGDVERGGVIWRGGNGVTVDRTLSRNSVVRKMRRRLMDLMDVDDDRSHGSRSLKPETHFPIRSESADRSF